MTSPRVELYLANDWLIRSNLNADFVCVPADGTSFSRAYFPWLPENSVLLGRNFVSQADFFVAQALMYWGLEGDDYYKKRAEEQSRLRAAHPHARFEDFVLEVLDQKNGLTYVVFDGAGVRTHLEAEAVLGANDKADDWVTTGYLGVEKLVPPGERRHILLHEVTERKAMARKRRPLGYFDAHDLATALEQISRRHYDLGIYPRDGTYQPIPTWEEACRRFEIVRA